MDIEPGAHCENTTVGWLTLKNTRTWMSIYNEIQPHVPWSVPDTSALTQSSFTYGSLIEKWCVYECVWAHKCKSVHPALTESYRCSATQQNILPIKLWISSGRLNVPSPDLGCVPHKAQTNTIIFLGGVIILKWALYRCCASVMKCAFVLQRAVFSMSISDPLRKKSTTFFDGGVALWEMWSLLLQNICWKESKSITFLVWLVVSLRDKTATPSELILSKIKNIFREGFGIFFFVHLYLQKCCVYRSFIADVGIELWWKVHLLK